MRVAPKPHGLHRRFIGEARAERGEEADYVVALEVSPGAGETADDADAARRCVGQAGLVEVHHLGGALAGAALTFLGLLRPTVHPPVPAATLSTRLRQRAHRALSLAAGTALLASIGVAIERGQPWLLLHPEQRQRVALGRAPLSLEVPRSFGVGQPGTGGEGSLSVVFDDLHESPAELTVIVMPHPQPLATAAEREYAAELQWQAHQAAAQAGEHTLTTRRLTIAELPVIELARTFPSGGRVQQLLQVRSHYMLKLRLRVPAGVPGRMVPPLGELLGTVREEPR